MYMRKKIRITPELIASFFNHSCTPDEAKTVAEYLTAKPEEAEKYIGFSEWDTAGVSSLVSDEFWERQWQLIEKRRTNRRATVRRAFRYAAAAVLIFMAAIGARYFLMQGTTNGNKIAGVVDSIETIENTLAENQIVSLPDGSEVALMPGSSLTFKKGYDAHKREIHLWGEAIFQVAKDSLRPFTVYSGRISTTALGTKFRIVYTKEDGDAKVFLYEGKVVIQSYAKNKIRKAFLQPGDQLSYNHIDGSIEIEKGERIALKNRKEAGAPKPNARIKEDSSAKYDKKEFHEPATAVVPTWYQFEKESLSNVFDQLAAIYNVEISYTKKDLENKYFIGKFEDTRSINAVLETIAEINDLKVERVDATHYTIKSK